MWGLLVVLWFMPTIKVVISLKRGVQMGEFHGSLEPQTIGPQRKLRKNRRVHHGNER